MVQCFFNKISLLTSRFHPIRRKMSKAKAKAKELAEGPPPLLGRVGTSLKCGIVGLPNVGFVKSLIVKY